MHQPDSTSPGHRAADSDELIVACAQVRGGNGRIDVPISLPGLSGVLHSTPSDGGRGGDVYFLSACGSGLLTRIFLADLVGHGERVSSNARRMHELLQRYVSRPDHRRILGALNDSLLPLGLDAMTTAAIFTYYPPTRAFTFTYAGHPPGWFFRAHDRTWSRLDADHERQARKGELVDGVLGVSDRVSFTRSRLIAEPGDRLLLVTDGVLETPGPDRTLFGAGQLEALLREHVDATPAELSAQLVGALTSHHRQPELDHDDVTILVLDVVDGPPGPAIWHVVRNRLLRRIGLVDEAARTRA